MICLLPRQVVPPAMRILRPALVPCREPRANNAMNRGGLTRGGRSRRIAPNPLEASCHMPTIARPDGATIYYEVHGSGYPLLLIAPGGVNSQVEIWSRSAFNPMKEFGDEFMVIGMDQRHAGRSPAPAVAWDYDQSVADQIAVLDALGLQRAHVMGGCIGCAHAWRLAHDAPDRVSGIIAQDPVGLDETNSLGTFFRMFDETMRIARSEGTEGVVAAAMANPMFILANGGGPFAQRIHDDEAFRQEILAMPREVYIALIVRYRDGLWPDNIPYFNVPEEWMATCPTPMLVLPGSDAFHPTGIAHRMCREMPNCTCLDVDCRSAEKLPATLAAIRAFMHEHAT
ncbi:hypothetical protein AYO38_03110 [bacterium SCGC AG-212-C10]|nr:hypothetical protein AYO38_03110 [bacterium SCGC AG-212-C10]